MSTPKASMMTYEVHGPNARYRIARLDSPERAIEEASLRVYTSPETRRHALARLTARKDASFTYGFSDVTIYVKRKGLAVRDRRAARRDSARRTSRRDDGKRATGRYAVYPHAVWKVTDHRTGDGHAVPTGQGYVDREITSAVPYGRMQPVRVFARRSDADKLASRLTIDLDLTGRESREEILAAMKRKPARDPRRSRARRDPSRLAYHNPDLEYAAKSYYGSKPFSQMTDAELRRYAQMAWNENSGPELRGARAEARRRGIQVA